MQRGDAVEQGVADFAIGPLPVRAWDGPLAVISWEEFVIVLPPNDPLAGRTAIRLEELADREWVLYHQDHGLAGILEEICRRAGFSPIGCFGEYAESPTSVCFEKTIEAQG